MFKPGDCVHLKSGGPCMTVEKYDGKEIWLAWFDDQKRLHRDRQPPETLAGEEPSIDEVMQLAAPARSKSLF